MENISSKEVLDILIKVNNVLDDDFCYIELCDDGSGVVRLGDVSLFIELYDDGSGVVRLGDVSLFSFPDITEIAKEFETWREYRRIYDNSPGL